MRESLTDAQCKISVIFIEGTKQNLASALKLLPYRPGANRNGWYGKSVIRGLMRHDQTEAECKLFLKVTLRRLSLNQDVDLRQPRKRSPDSVHRLEKKILSLKEKF